MADNNSNAESNSHLLRWLILIAIAVIGIASARRVALSKADAEFEARLLAADENRN